jgi:hypothetical protein
MIERNEKYPSLRLQHRRSWRTILAQWILYQRYSQYSAIG